MKKFLFFLLPFFVETSQSNPIDIQNLGFMQFKCDECFEHLFPHASALSFVENCFRLLQQESQRLIPGNALLQWPGKEDQATLAHLFQNETPSDFISLFKEKVDSILEKFISFSPFLPTDRVVACLNALKPMLDHFEDPHLGKEWEWMKPFWSLVVDPQYTGDLPLEGRLQLITRGLSLLKTPLRPLHSFYNEAELKRDRMQRVQAFLLKNLMTHQQGQGENQEEEAWKTYLDGIEKGAMGYSRFYVQSFQGRILDEFCETILVFRGRSMSIDDDNLNDVKKAFLDFVCQEERLTEFVREHGFSLNDQESFPLREADKTRFKRVIGLMTREDFSTRFSHAEDRLRSQPLDPILPGKGKERQANLQKHRVTAPRQE